MEECWCFDDCNCAVLLYPPVGLRFDELVPQKEEYRDVTDKRNGYIDDEAPTPRCLMMLADSLQGHEIKRTLVRYPPITGPTPIAIPFNRLNKELFLAFSLRETLSERINLVTTASPEKPSP